MREKRALAYATKSTNKHERNYGVRESSGMLNRVRRSLMKNHVFT